MSEATEGNFSSRDERPHPDRTVSREHADIAFHKRSGDRWYKQGHKGDGGCGLWIIRDGLSQEVHPNARGDAAAARGRDSYRAGGGEVPVEVETRKQALSGTNLRYDQGRRHTMYLPTATSKRPQIDASVRRVARGLSAHVAGITYEIERDWSGDWGIFFHVVLRDQASTGIMLGRVTAQVKRRLAEMLRQLDIQLRGYTDFRSESEVAGRHRSRA